MPPNLPNHGAKPKATTRRLVDPDVVEKTFKLFVQYKTIPSLNFSSLYKIHYDEIFCASELGFEDGHVGYFKELAYMIDKSPNRNEYSLKTHYYQGQFHYSNGKEYEKIRRINLSGVVARWPSNFKSILGLNLEDIYIPRSPYESLQLDQPGIYYSHIRALQKVLEEHPNGIPLNQIGNHVRVNKFLFKVMSIAELIAQYPEIFYLVEPEVKGQEAIVYDARVATHPCFGLEMDWYYATVMKRCLDLGLYYVTLVLILKTEQEGLKLGVWYEALKANFKEICQETMLAQVFKMQPIDLACLLASEKLLTIYSPLECRNDLRLMLPTQKVDPLVVRAKSLNLIVEGQTKLMAQQKKSGSHSSSDNPPGSL